MTAAEFAELKNVVHLILSMMGPMLIRTVLLILTPSITEFGDTFSKYYVLYTNFSLNILHETIYGKKKLKLKSKVFVPVVPYIVMNILFDQFRFPSTRFHPLLYS